jgi:hypothetical protein
MFEVRQEVRRNRSVIFDDLTFGKTALRVQNLVEVGKRKLPPFDGYRRRRPILLSGHLADTTVDVSSAPSLHSNGDEAQCCAGCALRSAWDTERFCTANIRPAAGSSIITGPAILRIIAALVENQ